MRFGYITALSTAKNLTEDSNYSNLYIASNVDDQSQVQNRDVRIKKLQSRWILDRAAAIELGSRYLERFAKAPIEADFALDAKDSNIALADFVQIDSPQHQDFSGSPLAILLQVVKRTEKSKQGQLGHLQRVNLRLVEQHLLIVLFILMAAIRAYY